MGGRRPLSRYKTACPDASHIPVMFLCAQRVRWGLLVMREVSLVGVSQAEAGYNSNSNIPVMHAQV